MARINRTDVIQKAVNDLALSTSSDKIPNETLDKIQLVYSLNRHFSSFITNGSRTTTGAMTITMPAIDARSEIYITSISLSVAKDATCDLATGFVGLSATNDLQGITKALIGMSVLTLTAFNQTVVIEFPYPLKLKPNTNLVTSGVITFTVGACSLLATVTGFITSSN